MQEITIPYNFTPRPYQVPLYNCLADGYRRAVAIWHRRSGKDKTLINLLTKEAFKRKGTYFYLLPTYAQGRRIIWDGMDRQGFKFLDHIPKEVRDNTNSTEMKITLRNGSIIQVIGSDSYNAIMGTNPLGCVLSEFALQDPRGWNYIRPILRENKGWAVFNSTPRGHNHLYDLHNMAKGNPDWFSQVLTVTDTGVLTEADVIDERKSGMDEDLVQQEFYCSFDAALPGAFFAKEMSQAREQGRICGIPIVPGIPVDTHWDLGMDDATSIWFSQTIGREIHLIDYEEHSGEGLAFYADLLRDKKEKMSWSYGVHKGPHDIEVRELGTGKSRLEIAREMGLKFEVVPRPYRKEDSIAAARNILASCWFDKDRCEVGIQGLISYRKDYDEKNKVFKLKPVHDWASHPSDAFQTLALGFQFRQKNAPFTPNRAKNQF